METSSRRTDTERTRPATTVATGTVATRAVATRGSVFRASAFSASVARASVAAAASAVGVTCLLVLAGCAGADADPAATAGPTPSSSPTTAAPSATPSPTGAPTGDPTAAPTGPETGPVALPVDCTDIVDRATYSATFGDIPLNPVEFGGSGTSSGVVTPTTPPAGASARDVVGAANELSCLWRDPRADVSGISVAMGHLSPAPGTAALDGFASQGYTCSTVHGGRSCQLVTPDPQYPVERTQTYWLRDDVVVTVDQTNVPTNDLIGSIATRLWG